MGGGAAHPSPSVWMEPPSRCSGHSKISRSDRRSSARPACGFKGLFWCRTVGRLVPSRLPIARASQPAQRAVTPSPGSAAVDKQACSQAAVLCLSRYEAAGGCMIMQPFSQGPHLCVAVPVGHHGWLAQDLLLRAACRVQARLAHPQLALTSCHHHHSQLWSSVHVRLSGREDMAEGRDERESHRSSRSPSARRPPRACRPPSWRCTAAPDVTMKSAGSQLCRTAGWLHQPSCPVCSRCSSPELRASAMAATRCRSGLDDQHGADV